MPAPEPPPRLKVLYLFRHKLHFIRLVVLLNFLTYLLLYFAFCIVNTRPFALVYLHDDSHLDGANVAALYELASIQTGIAAVNSRLDSSAADVTLVRAAQHGDRSAYGILYSRYAR